MFVVTIYIIYFFSIPKNKKKDLLILTLIALPCVYLIAGIAGYLYFDPRPFVVSHIAPLIPHAADNGFPSDHTLLTGAIASVIWYFNKKVSAFLWLLVLLVGMSRVLAGIHHITDIVGAIIISVVITALVKKILKK